MKEIERETLEDSGTARLVAQAKRDVAGGEPLLPIDVVERLANGENPIRVLRQFRGWTQAELATAERVGITQNYLSDLETGKRKGPFELHRKIADSLNVPFDLLSPIAVSIQEADPQRVATQKKAIAETRRSRGQK
ncbi:helix-turn-helix transcriptional regulator [Rhodopseudomonas palustris]|uniref:helix-turn-helix transcriptional regulator n=1 Tax=Rhodopseudomonas palustris TaxID=1076 RepID=UPI0022F0753E|nr:helix-turn-helix transcriptional regulator [Rhodopseudomonas palustris]WBU31765.1 helix-turn-helix transcriptional regulator [Rhodopseudomonas palustris]